MSSQGRTLLPLTLTMSVGILFGFWMANQPQSSVLAGGNDRSGDSITATGAVMVQMDAQKNATTLDAVYHLDYTGARLLAAIPSIRQSSATLNIIENFAERDLIADFKLSLTGPRPRFQMTTGSLGAQAQGMSVLYVFETTSKQVGVYRVAPHASTSNSIPRFELIQLKSYASTAPKD